MSNYRVHFYPEHRIEVLRTLRQFSQVRIDHVDIDGVGIFIEAENSEVFYHQLLCDIEVAVNTGMSYLCLLPGF